MGVLGCGFCGFQIRYHGEPEGTEPVEHIFTTINNWRELEKSTLTADWLENEHEEFFIYALRCKRCGTFTFFNYLLNNIGTYTPVENFSAAPMQEPFDFGSFWDDFQWFDITESDITAAEVFTKFPGNRWLAKNETEMRLYGDAARTKCIAQFKRFQRPAKVTVATMTLDAFKKILREYDDEIDFSYKKICYEVIKEKIDGGKIKIIVNEDFDLHILKYSATVDADADFTDDLCNTKIFPDGKSIAEAQAEIFL